MRGVFSFPRSYVGTWGAMPAIDLGMSAFKYHKIDNRKNIMAIRFFRWAIQATDSTFTGCTAKIRAARKPRELPTSAG